METPKQDVKGFNLTDLLPIVVGALGILAVSISVFCGDSCEADVTVRQWKDADLPKEYTD